MALLYRFKVINARKKLPFPVYASKEANFCHTILNMTKKIDKSNL